MGMKLKSRLSIGDVFGKVATKENMLKMIEGEEIPIVRVIGVATKVVAKDNDKLGGVSYKILGDFKMTNLASGETHRGSVLYLPSTGNQVIIAQLANVEVTSCQFGFDISAKYDESSPVQYIYEFEPLLPPSPNDTLALLEGAIARMSLPADPEAPDGIGCATTPTDETKPAQDDIDIAKAKAAKARKEKVSA